MGIALFSALAMFGALCGVLSLLISIYLAGRLIGFENTTHNVIPVPQDTSGLELFEKELNKIQSADKIKYRDLDPSPNVDELV